MNVFGEEHRWRWQAGMNGRNGGYLVLYQGEAKSSEYKSYCRYCGQINYQSVEESGNNICGRCRKPGRINYKKPPLSINTFPGRSTDMDEDFEDWSMDELRDRVTLVQEFDKLADDIVSEAVWLAENYDVVEEKDYVLETRKILVEC